MDAGVAGFGNAPVTRALLLFTAGSSLLLQGSTHSITVNRHVLAVLEPFGFRHLGELAFGSYLFYQFRTLERQRGAESFGAQTVVVLGVQQIVHWAVTSLTGWQSQIGPSALIASSFISFFKDVPALQRFKIVGIPATDKALVYGAGAQLLLSAGRASLPSVFAGALVGIAFQSNIFGCRRLKIPKAVSRLLGRTIGAVFGGSRPQPRVIAAGGTGSTSSGQPSQASQVSSEALEQLIAMGFQEQAARVALQQTGNDVQAALSRLL